MNLTKTSSHFPAFMTYIQLFTIKNIGHINATYAEILCLPFALLAASTFLPFDVLILLRNP